MVNQTLMIWDLRDLPIFLPPVIYITSIPSSDLDGGQELLTPRLS